VDSTQDVWDGLSDVLKSYLSRSVASIALRDGDTILFSCSGIAMERQGYNHRFLTTAGLVRAMNDTNKDYDDLEIEVRHESHKVFKGCLAEFDLHRNFAVVAVSRLNDVQFGPFQHALETLPHGEVLVVVGRDVSGKIRAKCVELNGEGISEDDEDLHCKTSEVWEGGPLLFVEHVVGMNLFLTTRRAIFRPWDIILKHLDHYSQSKCLKAYRFGARPLGEKSITYPHTVQGHYYFKDPSLDLDSKGYPKLPPTMLGAGMILANTFEETFGDTYNKGVWKKINNGASNIRRNVVALASFTGGKRFFACTGFFVKWMGSSIILTSASLVRNSNDDSKIVENFKIEVLLPNNQRTEGTLQHYNLHYNVALVSVKDYRDHLALNTVPYFIDHFEVAAVGRCFESGALLATCGELVNWTGTLDCKFLICSTCKITKAGIGGPLVNLHGDVVGMNFYDKKIGTPFLAWESICTILAMFEKSKLGEVGNDSDPPAPFWKLPGDENVLNRWPVPMPHWRHPDFLDEDKSDDDDDDYVDEFGNMKLFHEKYTYIDGIKYMLY